MVTVGLGEGRIGVVDVLVARDTIASGSGVLVGNSGKADNTGTVGDCKSGYPGGAGDYKVFDTVDGWVARVRVDVQVSVRTMWVGRYGSAGAARSDRNCSRPNQF